MAEAREIPKKSEYKLSEVCQYTDTQPYVLRFWESEFPQLTPTQRGGGQPVYSRSDLDLVQRIKQLLYEEEYTLADARKQLESETKRRGGGRAKKRAAPPPAKPRPAPRAVEPPPPQTAAADVVERARYERAIDEIDHLRLRLKESEKDQHRAEERAETLEQCLRQVRDILSS